MSSFFSPWFFLLSGNIFFLGCGRDGDRLHAIEETASANRNGIASETAPFHSFTGWQKAIPFFVDSTAPSNIIEAAETAASVWNDEVGREVLTFSGSIDKSRGSSLYSSLEDEITVIFYVLEWEKSTGKPDGTLATTVWQNAADSDRIVKGDILLNADVYAFVDSLAITTSMWQGKPVVDSETVLMHEFGHLMGLEHVSIEADPDSIMHAKTFIGPKVVARQPSELDLTHVKSLYD